MTESQKLQKELDEMMAKFNKTKKENTVITNQPKSNRKFTYRSSPVIKAHDIIV